jgi:toxin CptA
MSVTINLQLQPSRRLLCLGVVSLIWSIGWHAWRRFPRAPVSLRIGGDGFLFLGLRNGSEAEAKVLDSSFVHPWITILNLRLAGGRWSRNVILLPECVDAEAFRRLRVWLRWARPIAESLDVESSQ